MALVKPVLIDPNLLRPLAQTRWGANCIICDKPQSHWETPDLIDEKHVVVKKGGTLCALCFLYKSEWAVDREPELRAMVIEVEKLRAKEKATALVLKDTDKPAFLFEKDMAGRLVSLTDANQLLANIALFSRTMFMNAKQAAGRPAP